MCIEDANDKMLDFKFLYDPNLRYQRRSNTVGNDCYCDREISHTDVQT